MSEEQRRLFVALRLPAPVKIAAVALQVRLAELDLQRCRFTAEENLHLTLAFLGDVVTSRIPDIDHALLTAAKSSIPVQYGDVGTFRTAGGQVIWLHVDSPELQRFYNDVTNALAPWFSFRNQFRGHVTLARARVPLSRSGVQQLSTFSAPLQGANLTEVELIASELTSDGPIYTTLGSYPLTS